MLQRKQLCISLAVALEGRIFGSVDVKISGEALLSHGARMCWILSEELQTDNHFHFTSSSWKPVPEDCSSMNPYWPPVLTDNQIPSTGFPCPQCVGISELPRPSTHPHPGCFFNCTLGRVVFCRINMVWPNQ